MMDKLMIQLMLVCFEKQCNLLKVDVTKGRQKLF